MMEMYMKFSNYAQTDKRGFNRKGAKSLRKERKGLVAIFCKLFAARRTSLRTVFSRERSVAGSNPKKSSWSR